MRTDLRGFGGAALKKFFATTPLSLPKNEGNALFITKYSKNCLNCTESMTSFYASNALFTPVCARGNERLKGRKD